MAKSQCSICNKEMGALAFKSKLADGFICNNCMLSYGGNVLTTNLSMYSSDQIKDFLNKRTDLSYKFVGTKAESEIEIDEKNKLFKIKNDIFHFEQLIDYDLIEDGDSVTKGGLGRAVAGGILFGGVGAIVGGATGKKTTKSTCTSMQLRISIKNSIKDTLFIDFISSEVKTNGIIYKAAKEQAQRCVTLLEIILDEKQMTKNSTLNLHASSNPNVSAADEILKFKNLLDEGIISKEQFEFKKNELLGMSSANVQPDKRENTEYALEKKQHTEETSVIKIQYSSSPLGAMVGVYKISCDELKHKIKSGTEQTFRVPTGTNITITFNFGFKKYDFKFIVDMNMTVHFYCDGVKIVLK